MSNDSYIIYKSTEIDSLLEIVKEANEGLYKKANLETEKDIQARYNSALEVQKTFMFKFKSIIFYDVFKIFKKKKNRTLETYEEYKERVWKSFFRCNVGSTVSYLEYLKQMVVNAKKNNCDFELSFKDHKILMRLLDESDNYIYSLNKKN